MQKRILILVTLLFAVISNLTANGLKVIHPNGNEKFLGGKEITLKWENPNSYFPLNLYYSIDNAKNWILIDKNINVNEYKWKTPKIISNKCLFKVEYIQKGKDETIFESGQVSMLRTICFSPDSKYIASGSDDNSIKIWLTSNQTEIKKLSGHSSRIEYLSWSSNGKYLASASSSVVKVWDTSTWTVLYTLLQHSGSVFYVDWNKSSTFIASTGEDRTICIWDISNGSLKKQIITNHSLSNSCVTWSNDEKHIAVGSWDGSFSIWNAQTYQQEQKVTTSGGLRDIDYSYNDDYIATNSADAIVDVYNVSQNQLIYKITKHSSQGETIAWHHQKNIFASSARDGKVYIWDIDNSADLINEYVVTNCPVVDLDWDRSNDCIVASGISTKIHILCDAKDAADVDSSDAVWEIYGCPELNCQNITKDFYNTGKYTLELEIFNPTENPVE